VAHLFLLFFYANIITTSTISTKFKSYSAFHLHVAAHLQYQHINVSTEWHQKAKHTCLKIHRSTNPEILKTISANLPL